MDYLTKQILKDNPKLREQRDQGDFLAYLHKLQDYWLQYKRISENNNNTTPKCV